MNIPVFVKIISTVIIIIIFIAVWIMILIHSRKNLSDNRIKCWCGDVHYHSFNDEHEHVKYKKYKKIHKK